ncbi:putative Polycomb group protein ASXL2 isoform X1 [Paroedura picta]|uniref:putative Polycomb group protein ASXL2 isoform X1 n=1 Tax=Paroedura picta TaxID=143630 RepID=UPI004057AA04
MSGEQLSEMQLRVSTRLSQVSSPQPGCPSPSIPPGKVISSSQKHSKKALKQALKQKQRKQQQCRASLPVSSSHLLLQQHTKAVSHSVPVKPAWEGKQSDGHSSSPQNSTSSSSPSIKVEPSLPVLGKKPFQRSERLHARQLKRTKCAEIDVETPDSILVNTNLRALITKLTFSLLPADCQQRLLLLLPEVDRQIGIDGLLKLSSSALNNEFFTSAAQGWKERLSEGEFTPEMQLRLRQELEKEKKVELWKERFFESYYGQSSGLSLEESKQLTSFIPTTQAQARCSTVQVQPCLPVSVAVSSKEAAPPVDPKARDLLVSPPPAPEASKGDKEPQLQAPKSAEFASSSDSSLPSRFSDHIPFGPPRGTKELHVGSLESPAKEKASEPKSPAAAGNEATSGEDSQETPAKEASVVGTEQMDTGVQGLKRKSESPEQASTTPEKRPHVVENSRSPPPFQSPPQPFPAAPVPKVPPLRIPVSRLHGSPLPFPACQVSPGPSFPCTITSPRRTGARTLADIKARAQMARARRAAALAEAAASMAATAASIVGTIPGPGPGGGGKGEERGSTASGEPHGAATQANAPDLAGTGSGAGPRRPFPSGPGSWAPAMPPPTEQAAPCGVARTQLQPVPSLQPRTPGSCPGTETPSVTQPAVASRGPMTALASQGARVSLSTSCGLRPGMDQPGKPPSTLSQPARATCDPEHRPAGKHLPEAALAASTGVLRDTAHSPSLAPLSGAPFKAPAPPAPPAGIVATPPLAAPSRSTHGLKVPPAPSGAAEIAPPPKTSSSIPANNPLVAQLLQGKEVPMEQILPKPFTRVEMKTIPFPVKEQKEPVATARPGERQHYQVPLQSCGKPGFSPSRQQIPHSLQPFPPFAGHEPWNTTADLHPSHEALGQGAREHILQALMQRLSRQKLSSPTTPPSQLALLPPELLGESSSTSQSFMLGFTGRRTSKPAMSGHYLLNVSTYGRGSEHLRRKLAMHPEDCASTDGPKMEFEDQEQRAGSGSSEEDGGDTDGEGTADEEECVVVKEEITTHEGRGEQNNPQATAVKAEQVAAVSKVKGAHQFLACQKSAGSAVGKGFIQASQEKAAQTTKGEMRSWSTELHIDTSADSTLPQPLLLYPSPPSRLFGNPAAAQLVGPGYSGTINVSTSPDLHQEALLTGLSDPSSIGDVVSFSVTVTTIPAGQSASIGSRGQPLSAQAFSDTGSLEDLPSKCYCRLKAMIMCKGCGAFCHDDCIGPSKLCVSCLVVR